MNMKSENSMVDPSKTKPKKAVLNQSVVKALQIIELMAKFGQEIRIQEIAQELNLSSSTVLRFVNTLETQGYVEQNPNTLKYHLTFKISHLGFQVAEQVSIRDLVRPYLTQMSRQCGESTCLAVMGDLEVLYVDVVNGQDNILQIAQRIGKRAPLHSTGVGKLLLLNYTDEEIERIIRDKGLVVFTKNTIATKEQLFERLDEVRSGMYAMDDEECEMGVRCVSAPIIDYTNKVIAAISASGPTHRMQGENLERVKNIVISTAKSISIKLGKTDI